MAQRSCRVRPLREGDLSMIVVQPMPDELAIAHEGRLALVNGISSRYILYDRLAVYWRTHRVAADVLPDMRQLAWVAEMTPTAYASNLSMMPVIRVACRVATAKIACTDLATSEAPAMTIEFLR